MENITHLMLGAGRMGGALLGGWTKGRSAQLSPEQILIVDPQPGETAQKVIDKGALHQMRIETPLNSLTYLILAVKPQNFDEICAQISPYIPKDCVVISIMAGVSLSRLSQQFPARPLVRAMPNTPASIGKGMTAFTVTKDVSAEQVENVRRLLSATGEVAQVPNENMIDIVTAVSGSGPAYVFYLTEALEAAAVDIGMKSDDAKIFARHTVIGAAALMDKSKESAEELRIAVTSPKGTTQAALDVLMGSAGFAPVLKKAVRAAFKRAKELA